jgi:chromosome segregation protein
MLRRCEGNLQDTSADLQNLSQTLIARRQQYRELQLQSEQQQSQQQKANPAAHPGRAQLQQSQQELSTTQARLAGTGRPPYPPMKPRLPSSARPWRS